MTCLSTAQQAQAIPVFLAVRRAGLALSHGEARRLVRAGLVRVNGLKVLDEASPMNTGDHLIVEAGFSQGSRRSALVERASQ